MVAVSGGKDSMSLLHALKEISKTYPEIKVFAFHINLGIFDYSRESEKVVVNFTKKIRVPLILANVKEEIGFTIPELVNAVKKPPCSICGIVKRWLMNKVAYEAGFDWIATGHNLDDISTYLAKAMFTQDLYTLRRAQFEVSEGDLEKKLIARIRPQFYLTEYENRLYVELNEIPIVQSECPYGAKAPIHKYKEVWYAIKSVNPIAQINFVRSIKKLLREIPTENVELKLCRYCGYPTQNPDAVCAFCKIIQKAKEYYGSE